MLFLQTKVRKCAGSKTYEKLQNLYIYTVKIRSKRLRSKRIFKINDDMLFVLKIRHFKLM
jgi:hypothetical protein